MIGRMPTQSLDYLLFDATEDEEGHGSFDAMAAVEERRWPALQAEVARVLGWAHAGFGPPSPLDEGGEWDCELAGVRELTTPLAVHWVEGSPALELQEEGEGRARITLTVTLTGTPGFCDAFRREFGVD